MSPASDEPVEKAEYASAARAEAALVERDKEIKRLNAQRDWQRTEDQRVIALLNAEIRRLDSRQVSDAKLGEEQ